MMSIFNDAAGCYDRMLHNLMTIATRRMECPKEAALCHTKVVNNMKHFIKTDNGISKQFIQASTALPLSRCEQGNGGGPISWHTHMEPLIQAYYKANKGFSFQDPAQLIKFTVGDRICRRQLSHFNFQRRSDN